MIVIGGSMCQYEDNVQEYLNVLKMLYKDLITVAIDPESGEIKVHSFAFQITGVDGNMNALWSVKYHPQNWFFVIVDPIHWHCTLVYHKWTNFW
jgi:hypothetical protein